MAMDSVRSEYSDTSSTPGTSRVVGGDSSGALLSFVDSSSFGSSRQSTTRSDFLSNYEHKFLERKAEKKKKRERERRRAEASINQLTADDKRRADREVERLVRQAEMATWLPTKEALGRVDWERKKRSAEKLREVLRWYPPLAEEEAGRARAAKTNPTEVRTRLEDRKRHTEIQPLFLPDSAHARDARRLEDQCGLERQIASGTSMLQRRVLDLQQKMLCIEQMQADCRSPGRQRQGKRRGPASILAPLALAESTSLPLLPPHHPRRLHGSSMRGSRTISMSYFFRDTPDEENEALVTEAAELEIFLNVHKRQRRREWSARKIQATWCMFNQRRRYTRWKRWRTKTRAAFFQVWALSHRITKQSQRAAKRKYLRAWRDEVLGAIQLQLIELRLFREAETQPELPKIVMNLVFMADEDDDAYTRRVLAHPMKQSFYTGFVNAAFASVEQLTAMTNKNRVRLIKTQHLEARRAVAKKIVQRMFLLWKRVHADGKRVGLNAQLCIKRAARLAFQRRPVWAGEKMLTIFELWARWAAFARSKRLHVPMPHFAQPLPLWDVWLHNYQERQVRKVKAAAKAPLARMKRCFRSFRAFAAFALRKRLAVEKAARHFRCSVSRTVLLEWRDAIAETAFHKKLSRSALLGWRGYAARKRRMRPWKEQVVVSRLRREQERAWRVWRNVQLRSCFKRELHRARLVSQPKWRRKVQRLLLVWMDIRSQLHKWKVYVAWKHSVQRRKLFLTVRSHCVALGRKHLLHGVFGAWKAVVWKQEDEFLEDRLRLSAWDTYKELSPLLPMLFYGCYSDAAAIFGGVPSAQTDSTATTQASTRLVEGDIDVLAKRQRDIRAYHIALLQGSILEARNLILNHRHLINGVDDLTGNTALHVAAGQLEDVVRRFEITTLLLSEGATTSDKLNRHGLTPKQLAPDDRTRQLLERGIYPFHSHGILDRARKAAFPALEQTESRLVWCLVAKMSSEYTRGDRIAGDVRHDWHSELKDELWLRRGRVCFASTSIFSATIHRCRAFVNGMRQRICRSKDEVLLTLWDRYRRGGGASAGPARHVGAPPFHSRTGRCPPMRPVLLKSATRRVLSRMEEKVELLSWLKSTPDDPISAAAIQKETETKQEVEEQAALAAKARSLGEYSAYAEALLWPVINDEAAQHELVQSFVGVLYSLAFPVDVVLAEALRLEEECAKLENDVMQSYQAIMCAELRHRAPDQPMGTPLLRYFTEPSDAEFFFKREILLVDVELFRRKRSGRGRQLREDDAEDGSETEQRVANLQLEVDMLLAKAQRKQRKVHKKVAAVEQQVASLNDANLRVVLTNSLAATNSPQERLAEICSARIRLENERLRVANLRLKQIDWPDKMNELIALKRSLGNGEEGELDFAFGSEMEDDELMERRAFLEAQLARYVLELKPNGSSRGSSGTSTTGLRQLHKAAVSTLWSLFIKNLFRSCFCWLVENLTHEADGRLEGVEHGSNQGFGDNSEAVVELEGRQCTKDAHQESVKPEIGSIDSCVLSATVACPVRATAGKTFAVATTTSAAIRPASVGTVGKRRSSLSNGREVFDTMQRSAAAAEMAELHANAMRENYASSSQLLFESDRGAMHLENELVRQRATKQSQLTHARARLGEVAEVNPLSGLPETSSSRLMSGAETAALSSSLALPVAGGSTEAVGGEINNRKRQLLRQAMVESQLRRLAQEPVDGAKGVNAETTESSNVYCSKGYPFVDGIALVQQDGFLIGLGNFVSGSSTALESSSSLYSSRVQKKHQVAQATDVSVAAVLAESLWKHGGGVRRHHDSPATANGLNTSSTTSSLGVRGAGFDLFASAEDEMAFNAAFRVTSASQDRRSSPKERRLSTIATMAGAGLNHQDVAQCYDKAPAMYSSDESGPSFEGFLGSKIETPTPDVEIESTMNDDDSPPTPEQPEESDALQGRIQYDNVEKSNLAGLGTLIGPASSRGSEPQLPDFTAAITATEEAEFFDQTLRQYLDRVRRDSLVVLKEPSEPSPVASLFAGPSHSDIHSNDHPMAADPGAVTTRLTADGSVDGSVEYTKTTRVKRDQTPGEIRQLNPLQVASSSLLTQQTTAEPSAVVKSSPYTSQDDLKLRSLLCELDRKERDEQVLQEQSGQPLLLSGTTTVFAGRRRKTTFASTLKRGETARASNSAVGPSIQLLTREPVTIAEDGLPLASDEVSLNPSFPKITVAIQHRPSRSSMPHDDCETIPQCEGSASAAFEPVSSSKSKLSSQQPLQLARCEVTLQSGHAKISTVKVRPQGDTASRRRTILAGSYVGNARRKPIHTVDSAFELRLEGASTLTASATANDVAPNASTKEVRDLHISPAYELTEQQKRGVWREFVAAPLTETMQDAYAQLYPCLYDPASVAPSGPPPSDRTDPSSAPEAVAAALPLHQQIALGKRFWSAVEGFKAVGQAGIVALDDKTLKARRVESAVALYQQFLCPNGASRLPWLDQHTRELRAVEKRLLKAPTALFDSLQQAAQLQVATLQAKGQAR